MKSRQEIETGLVSILFKFAVTVAIGMGVCGIISLLAGCSKKIYVPVENVTVRTDTVHHTEHIVERDTVTRIERIAETRLDSIAPILDSSGRMIGYDRWHVIDRSSALQESNNRLTAIVDSLKQRGVSTEKIREPYPVERKLTKWEKMKMDIGGIAIGVLAVILCIAVLWLIKKKRR